MSEDKIPQGSNNAEKVVGWIERLSALLKKNGLQNILVTFMVVFIAIVVGHIAFNPSSFVNKIEEVQNKQHAEYVLKRLEADPYIYSNLTNLLKECNSQKALVFETHNGGSNLSSLPFLYVDLTYCIPKSEMEILEPEYKNVRLSRYPWASHMYTNNMWLGDVEELKEIDPELYYRLIKDDVVYMGAILVYGNDSLPCGMVLVVYTKSDEIPSSAEIAKVLQKYSSVMATLLVPPTK